jgi:hypothetical protein
VDGTDTTERLIACQYPDVDGLLVLRARSETGGLNYLGKFGGRHRMMVELPAGETLGSKLNESVGTFMLVNMVLDISEGGAMMDFGYISKMAENSFLHD